MNRSIFSTFACLIIGIIACGVSPAQAREFFVSTTGDNNADGMSMQTAVQTIQQGVDKLNPGDTLTIAPGEYFETVSKNKLGDEKQTTTIQAQIPGTVLLRGDKPLQGFTKVKGYQFVYAVNVEKLADGHAPQAVKELDTLWIFEKVLTIDEVDRNPGTFYYDQTQGKLYLSSTDLRAPRESNYTVCVIPESGLFLNNPKNVIVDGVSATGFYRAQNLGTHYGVDTVFGISLINPDHCIVRNCTSYMNAGAIILAKGADNVMDNCTAYGNRSSYQQSGGGLFSTLPTRTIIKNSTSFLNDHYGIEMYLDSKNVGQIFDSVAWGNTGVDIQLKGGSSYLVKGSVGLTNWYSEVRFHHIENCIIYDIPEVLEAHKGHRKNNLILNDHRDVVNRTEFADADHHDYRLQPKSRFRHAAPDGSDLGPAQYKPNVFYVSLNGDDANDGLSFKQSWRTLQHAIKNLKGDDTLYIEPGTYPSPLRIAEQNKHDKTIYIKRRSHSPVFITGNVEIEKSSNLVFEGINFQSAVQIQNSDRLSFNNCYFAAKNGSALQTTFQVKKTHNLRITHCQFGPNVIFEDSRDLYLSSNLFESPIMLMQATASMPTTIAYADYNGYSESLTYDVPVNNRPIHAFWIMGRDALTHDQLKAKGFEQHGKMMKLPAMPALPAEQSKADVNNDDQAPTLLIPGGALGSGMGPFEFTRMARPSMRVSPLQAHSVSDTTANIEWTTSTPSTSKVAWGLTPECENEIDVIGPNFVNFSLTGLEPGKTYYMQVRSASPLVHMNPRKARGTKTPSQTISFTTATKPAAPITWYVATDGDDTNDGRSSSNAWRSIAHATDHVNAGDTVMIAGGRYTEAIYLRATGDVNKPITFQAIPGQRVVMDSDDRNISTPITIVSKHHINFDGIIFRKFATIRQLWVPYTHNGVITMAQSSNIHITRCMMDARGRGYAPRFVVAFKCQDLLIKNCVITTGFANLNIQQSPNTRIENSVLIRSMIMQMNFSDGPVYMTNNIITDSLAIKENVPMFEGPHMKDLILENNCFYLRREDEKDRKEKIFRFFRNEELGNHPLKRQASIAMYDAMLAPSHSVLVNPGFAGEKVDATDAGKYYTVDQFIKPPHNEVSPEGELHFSDFFTTNPILIKRGIGLQRDVFEMPNH